VDCRSTQAITTDELKEKKMEETQTKVDITIVINDRPYHVHVEEMTGLQIKQLAGIPENNLLFRETHGPGDDEKIENNSVVQLHDGDKFYDMPPGNFGGPR
jgi:hypothetical protein